MKLKVKETEILKSVKDYLTIKGYIFFRNNTGAYVTGKRFIRYGAEGWPDLVGMDKKGVFMGIEVKSDKGKLSDSQILIRDKIIRSNGIYIEARSLQDIIDCGY